MITFSTNTEMKNKSGKYVFTLVPILVLDKRQFKVKNMIRTYIYIFLTYFFPLKECTSNHKSIHHYMKSVTKNVSWKKLTHMSRNKNTLNIPYLKKKLCKILKYENWTIKNNSCQHVYAKTNVVLKRKSIILNIFTRRQERKTNHQSVLRAHISVGHICTESFSLQL